jgi:uncharacterized protein
MGSMRNPFLIDVGEELRHPGVRRILALAGPLPGLALSTTRVPDGADVEADLVVEAQGATVIVRGTARAPWVGECRRCLGPTSGEITVELHEVFEANAVEGETFPLVGELADLAPMLRESLALGLPLAPLCGEDCAGPDPDSHPVRVPDDHADDARPTDPRWAALDELRFDA